MENPKVSRRIFMMTSGGGAAVALASSALAPAGAAQAATPPVAGGMTTLNYPRRAVGKASGMPVNQAVSFSYPDASSPCYAIRMGGQFGFELLDLRSQCRLRNVEAACRAREAAGLDDGDGVAKGAQVHGISCGSSEGFRVLAGAAGHQRWRCIR